MSTDERTTPRSFLCRWQFYVAYAVTTIVPWWVSRYIYLRFYTFRLYMPETLSRYILIGTAVFSAITWLLLACIDASYAFASLLGSWDPLGKRDAVKSDYPVVAGRNVLFVGSLLYGLFSGAVPWIWGPAYSTPDSYKVFRVFGGARGPAVFLSLLYLVLYLGALAFLKGFPRRTAKR